MKEILGMTDVETIGRLADMVKEKELSEITVCDGERMITIKGRECAPLPAPAFIPQMNMAALTAPSAPAAQPEQAPKQEAVSGNVVKSPIVGTFYASPSPDKPAFVKVGDKVVYSKYSGTEVKLSEDETYTIVKESDILATIAD